MSVQPNINIFIVRHGRSLGQDDITAYKSIGDHSIPLTEKGIAQSTASGKLISEYIESKNIQLTSIFNSTCKRTEQTADLIQTELIEAEFVPRHPAAELDKQKFGVFDGMFSNKERQEKEPDAFIIFQKQVNEHGLIKARPLNGESISDVLSRSETFLSKIFEQGGTHIVVTHGLVALCLEKNLMGLDDAWLLSSMDKMQNCEVRRISGNTDTGLSSTKLFTDSLPKSRDFSTLSA